MKVSPAAKTKVHEKMHNSSKINQYLQHGFWMLAYWFGIIPFKIDKETWALSFRWISSETFWSLVRLVVINAPFSFLPVILWGVYGPAEWEKEGGFANVTSQTTSNWPPVWFIVFAVEYISSYAYFILQRAAKKKIFDANVFPTPTACQV